MKREPDEINEIIAYFEKLRTAIAEKDELFDYEYFFKTIYFNEDVHEEFSRFADDFINEAIKSANDLME